MTRPSRVVIDRTALQHNFNRVKAIAPDARVMAIVKADAYGHGITRVASLLADADAFGVACIEEARQLRGADITQSIVLLEGPHKTEELSLIQDLNLDVVVHNHAQIEMLKTLSLTSQTQVWIKIDTGMHRLGFKADEINKVWSQLSRMDVNKIPHLMTHLAVANLPEHQLNQTQLSLFNDLTSAMDTQRSVANSAAILSNPDTHMDWVRPGLMLYGVSPFPDQLANDYDLRPVMALESELISVQSLKKGDSVGYGASWCCPEDMPVGIVAAGYGDGYPRHAVSGTPVLVNGTRCSMVGRASMDMLTVDLRNSADAKMGDPVTLWGHELPIEEIARSAHTIPYELLCGVHKRLEFVEHG